MSTPAAVRGRYAPSPTGELHVGNASTALLAWLSVRAAGGAFVMRVEDLDRNRSRARLVDEILGDLAWLGLDWDEGPDVGGPHEPYVQGARFERYRVAWETLRARGRLYPCFCSRSDILVAASAPQEPGDDVRYPGTCRAVEPRIAERRIAAGERHAWRFRVDGEAPGFVDRVFGATQPESAPGDFVVHRADGVPAYQLAVVVDDAAMDITEVVRGNDLLSSTPRQLLLFDALRLQAPSFAHVPLLLGPDGVRLSKRHRGVTVRELREAGHTAESIVGALARLLGLRQEAGPVATSALIDGFTLDLLRRTPTKLTLPETLNG